MYIDKYTEYIGKYTLCILLNKRIYIGKYTLCTLVNIQNVHW